MAGMRVTRRRFAVIMAGVCLALAVRVGAVNTDLDLFRLGDQAFQQRDYLYAALYLFAYVQRSPVYMQQDPNHAASVSQGLEEAISRLRSSINASQAAGVGGEPLRPPPPPLVAPGPAQQPSQPLVCRGGGRVQVNLFSDTFGLPGTMVAFRFARGGAPNAPGPGQCSWVNRPVDPSEPEFVCDPIEASTLHFQVHADNGQLTQISSASAQYVSRLASGEGILTFRAFNNGQCLVVTTPATLNAGRGRGRGRGL